MSAAVLYSLVASAKRHHLDPQAYLTDVLTRLPQLSNPLELRSLLPDRPNATAVAALDTLDRNGQWRQVWPNARYATT